METHRFENKIKLVLTPHQEGIKRVFWNNLMAFNALMTAMLVAFLPSLPRTVGKRLDGGNFPTNDNRGCKTRIN